MPVPLLLAIQDLKPSLANYDNAVHGYDHMLRRFNSHTKPSVDELNQCDDKLNTPLMNLLNGLEQVCIALYAEEEMLKGLEKEGGELQYRLNRHDSENSNELSDDELSLSTRMSDSDVRKAKLEILKDKCLEVVREIIQTDGVDLNQKNATGDSALELVKKAVTPNDSLTGLENLMKAHGATARRTSFKM